MSNNNLYFPVSVSGTSSSGTIYYNRITKIGTFETTVYSVAMNRNTGAMSGYTDQHLYGTTYETWTFTLMDDTTVTKDVVLK